MTISMPSRIARTMLFLFVAAAASRSAMKGMRDRRVGLSPSEASRRKG
jgi:hypothetical protein